MERGPQAMKPNMLLSFISGIGGGLMAVALMVWLKRRRGEVFGDELTHRIKEQASLVGYLALIVTATVLWLRDISTARDAGVDLMAAVAASPFTWLLIVGYLSWLGGMIFYGWRSGLYQGRSGNGVFTILAILALLIGFVPVPWAALAQLSASMVLLVGGVFWFMAKQDGR